MDMLFGMKIVPHPLMPATRPNYRLAPGDYISDEFRAKMDAWCDEFFGRSPYFLIVQGDTILANNGNIEMVKAAFRERYPQSCGGTENA